MRYALISDIHANLPALDAVLADIARHADVDAAYHLGDLVGYGPWPNETVSRLRAAGIAGSCGAPARTGGITNSSATPDAISRRHMPAHRPSLIPSLRQRGSYRCASVDRFTVRSRQKNGGSGFWRGHSSVIDSAS